MRSYSSLLAVWDEEVLSVLFSDRRRFRSYPWEGRLINSKSWPTVPPRLQQKYMRFRLKFRAVEPNVFAYLFLPVVDARLKELGAEEQDSEARSAVVDELLRVVKPRHDFAWVIAHKSWNSTIHINKALDKWYELNHFIWQRLDRPAYADPNYWAWVRKEQINSDHRFALLLCAVLKDDAVAVSSMLLKGEWQLAAPSLCFGTTVLAFTLAHGSMQVVRIMLEHRSVRATSYGYGLAYQCLTIAAQRSDSAPEIVSLLLESLIGGKPEANHRDFIVSLFERSCSNGDLLVLDCVLGWVNTNCTPGVRAGLLQHAVAVSFMFSHMPIIKRVCEEIDINGYFHGHSVFSHAIRAMKRDIAVLHFLIEQGFLVNATRPLLRYSHLSSVFMAAWRGQADWVEVLLKAGANPQSVFGETPFLWYAEAGGILKEASILLEKYGWDREDLEDKKQVSFASSAISGMSLGPS